MPAPEIPRPEPLTAAEQARLDQLQQLLDQEDQRRISVMGLQARRYLLQWAGETRETVLDALETVEDLMEAIALGNDVM